MGEKKLYHRVILHSNDLHADFHSRETDEKLVGGISRLSGYLKKVRAEYGEENVDYVLAGDMFRGDVIDSEYLGLSTINIINYLKPEVSCVGNHEIDYGIAHSLILEKMADFPVINANVYFKETGKRFYKPYFIMWPDECPVLIIGVITEEVSHQLLLDTNIGAFLEVHDPAEEVKKVITELGADNFAAVYVLSHIGLEADIRLAKELDPSLGVRGIIGGHSHTLMEKPEIVNGIPIVQAGTGTGQIGRFDVYYDEETLETDHWSWQTVEISDRVCDVDQDCEAYVEYVRKKVDAIYSEVLFKLKEKATNPIRNGSTTMNKLYADIMARTYGLDMAMVNGGAVRTKELGPLVTKGDFKAAYPYQDGYYACETTVGGAKKLIREYYLAAPEPIADPHASILMCSERVSYTWNDAAEKVEEFHLDGIEPADDAPITIGLNTYVKKSLEGRLADLLGTDVRKIGPEPWEDIQALFKKYKKTVPLSESQRVKIIL